MDFKVLTPADKEAVKDYIDRLPEGKPYEVSVKARKTKRSLSQNALYHSWLACISKETGNDQDSLHKYFARKFLGVTVEKVFGEKVAKVVSTTTLDTAQFTTYLDQIQAFVATELDIMLPLPEDRYLEQFLDKYGTL